MVVVVTSIAFFIANVAVHIVKLPQKLQYALPIVQLFVVSIYVGIISFLARKVRKKRLLGYIKKLYELNFEGKELLDVRNKIIELYDEIFTIKEIQRAISVFNENI